MIAWIKRSFKRQIILVLFSLISLISALILIRLYYSEKHNLMHILESQAIQMVETLAIAINNNVRYSNYMELSDSISHIFKKNQELALKEGNLFQITAISVVDQEHKILAHSDPLKHKLLLQDTAALAYEKRFKNDNGDLQYLWDEKETGLLLRRPIYFGLEEIGILYVDTNAVRLFKSEMTLLQNIFILALILAAVLLLIVYYFGRWVEKPLDVLIHQLDKIGEGTIAFPALMNRKDEFYLLAASVVAADRRISQQKEELYKIHRDLEKRVELEVDKNREKDYMMIQQSRQAQMGEMISMIAHQWRQPLASISAAAVSLQMSITLNRFGAEEFNERLENITIYADHLSKTIDDFRDYFKPNKQAKIFKPSTSVKNALKLCEMLFHNKAIEVEVHLESDAEITSFENELMQVIINLLKNAADVLEEKGIDQAKVTVRLTESDETVDIEIADNGGGIDEQFIDKIFDPYFSTKSKNGTGLGLYMSRSIVEEHCEGRLSVSNKNKGASFLIELKKFVDSHI